MTDRLDDLDTIWSRHHAQWRDCAQVASQWDEAGKTDPDLLVFETSGNWWETLASLDLTLLITREYEHLLLAMTVENSQPHMTFFSMPHPSGLTVDRDRGIVHVASTRNPNQIFDLMPVEDSVDRLDVRYQSKERQLVPVSSNFLPGCTYMHDLAIVNGELYANAVGHNAIIKLDHKGSYQRVWWPECIEVDGKPVFGQNHIQLNSIAAGADLESSYFSASSTAIESLRPGDQDYPVDGRGVVFSGTSRQPVISGLTRPHSARIINNRVYVDNSGYGELGFGTDEGKIETVARLPGWTRGLAANGDIAFVGTSRVIPRFAQYAPGLNVNTSVCGIHAVDLESGEILGSLTWPNGNQIFAIEWVPSSFTSGFPFSIDRREEDEKLLFYTFTTSNTKGMIR